MVKKEPKFSPHHLMDAFEKWANSGESYKFKDERSGQIISRLSEFSRQGLVSSLVVDGKRQFVSFRSGSLEPRPASESGRDFILYVPGNLKQGEIESAIEKNFEEQPGKVREYRNIFGSTGYDRMEIGFQDRIYHSIRLTVPITGIPLGGERRISSKLFNYSEEFISSPIREIQSI